MGNVEEFPLSFEGGGYRRREMRGRYFVLLGIILIAVEILVRVLVKQPAGIYTNLDLVYDVMFVVGIICIIVGIFFRIIKKRP